MKERERAEIFALTSNRRCGEKEQELFNVSGDYERNVSRCRNTNMERQRNIESETFQKSSQWQLYRHDHIKVITWMVHVNGHFTSFNFWQKVKI